MITREFNLYLHAGHSIPLVINCNQYDQGEQWLFTLFNADGTQYTPSSGAIVGIKSDNLGIINSGTVDSQGRVVINETQQMTAAVGKAVFELVIDDGTHGTANFVVLVEEKPGNNADLSETDISMIEEAIEAASTIKPYGSPLVASTVAGMTDETKVYVYTGSETGYTSGHWYYYDGSNWADGGVYNSVAVQTDTTLAISGMAADAKKTGDEISDLKSQINSGVPYEVKQALDNILQNVAFKNDDGYSTDLTAIHNWANTILLTSISAVFDQGQNIIYDRDSLDDLRQYLTVTASYDNGTSATVSNYELSGTLTEGTSTITVTYNDKTTTFNVTVTKYVYTFHLDGIISGYDSTMGVGDNAKIQTTSNANRAVTNPLVVPIPSGTYRFTFPSVCKAACFVAIEDGTIPSLDTVDWTNTGVAKTWYTGTIVKEWNELPNAGWNFVSGNTFTMAKDGWLLFHLQATSGNTISSEAWKTAVLEGLSITEVES